MGNPYYEEEQLEETNPSTLLHFEAMERWRQEAEKLYEIMRTDDIQDSNKLPTAIHEETRVQVQSLIEELIEDDILDPRLSWTAKADY